MEIENIFGLDKKKTLLIILASITFAVAMFIKILMPKENENWQIIHNGEYYLTSDPVVTGGCVVFTDENDQVRKICGSYKMKSI